MVPKLMEVLEEADKGEKDLEVHLGAALSLMEAKVLPFYFFIFFFIFSPKNQK